MRVKNLLVHRIGHLGDTVVSLPALWAVRHSAPSIRLVMLSNVDTSNSNYVSPRAVLPPVGLVDDWIDYPSSPGFRSLFSLWLRLKKERFDAVLYLATRIRSERQIKRDLLFFRLAGIKRVLGVEYLRNSRLPEHIDQSRAVLSELDYTLGLVRKAGFATEEKADEPGLSFTDEEIATARSWIDLHTAGPLPTQSIIAVAPGCKQKNKVWPEASFRSAVLRLIEDRNCFPIVVGGSEDKEIGDRLVNAWGRGSVACGELSVRKSAALMSMCDLFLGNDSGPMHLAAAAGTRCVAIFAANDWPGKWHPAGTGHVVFRSPVACPACVEPQIQTQHLCMSNITVDEVHAACLEVLSESL